MRMGMATLAIMVLPIWINSAGSKSCRERVRVNQVPQNTPVTSMTRTAVMNVIDFCRTMQSNAIGKHPASQDRLTKEL